MTMSKRWSAGEGVCCTFVFSNLPVKKLFLVCPEVVDNTHYILYQVWAIQDM